MFARRGTQPHQNHRVSRPAHTALQIKDVPLNLEAAGDRVDKLARKKINSYCRRNGIEADYVHQSVRLNRELPCTLFSALSFN